VYASHPPVARRMATLATGLPATALTGLDLHQLDSNKRFHQLILVPPLPRFPSATSHFVTSTTAPIASGWSKIAGWDLHPLENAALTRRTPETDILPFFKSELLGTQWSGPPVASSRSHWPGCQFASIFSASAICSDVSDSVTSSSFHWYSSCPFRTANLYHT